MVIFVTLLIEKHKIPVRKQWNHFLFFKQVEKRMIEHKYELRFIFNGLILLKKQMTR